jgi:hypothetical protein
MCQQPKCASGRLVCCILLCGCCEAAVAHVDYAASAEDNRCAAVLLRVVALSDVDLFRGVLVMRLVCGRNCPSKDHL